MPGPKEALCDTESAQAYLLKLGRTLRALSDAVAVQSEACRLLGVHLGVDRAYCAEVEGARHEVHVRRDYLRGDSTSTSLEGKHRACDLGWDFEAMRQGQTAIIADAPGSERVSQADRTALSAMRIAAYVNVPLVKDDALIGALCVTESVPREWTDMEIELVQATAERMWAAIALARSERALRDSETKLQTAIEDVPLAMALTGPAGEILVRNPRFDQLWGRPAHLTTARTYSEVYEGYHLDGRPIASEEWPGARAVLEGEVVENEVYEIVQASGQRIKCWFGAAPIRNASGEVSGGVVVFRDVTEELRTQAALREREERQAFLLKLSDALRPLLDPIAIQAEASRVLREYLGAGRVVYWEVVEDGSSLEARAESAAAGQPSFIGRRLRFEDLESAATGMFPQNRLAWQDDVNAVPGIGEKQKAAFAAASSRAYLSAPLVKEGRFIACLTVLFEFPHTWSEEELRLVEEVSERTWAAVERALAEAALRENETRLQKANRAKDEFLAMLGHELRNPLAPIATTLQVMKLRAPDVFVRERGIIEAQVRHLTALVGDLLDVARIAHGKFDLDSTPVQLAEVVATAVETVRPQMEEKRQSLQMQVADGVVVKGDRRRLVQVLVNLLGNAAKYSPSGRRIQLSAVAEDGHAVLRVRDEGQGIDPQLLPHVFDSFTQGAQSLDRAHGGLGLGLTIVRDLVRLHGGSVKAASEGLGNGSEFTVRLPLLNKRPS